MVIRKYRPSDCERLAELFYQTVHAVNARDYTKEQLDAWASGCVDLEKNVTADRITTHASITAKSFFEHKGYRAVREQQVLRDGISLTNFMMEK